MNVLNLNYSWGQIFESTQGKDNKDDVLTLRNHNVPCTRVQETHNIIFPCAASASGGRSQNNLFGVWTKTDFGSESQFYQLPAM